MDGWAQGVGAQHKGLRISRERALGDTARGGAGNSRVLERLRPVTRGPSGIGDLTGAPWVCEWKGHGAGMETRPGPESVGPHQSYPGDLCDREPRRPAPTLACDTGLSLAGTAG